MFKKSLAALAVLGAFAGAACAANVSLYGIADAGLRYNHYEGAVDKHSFTLDTGASSASRFGLKGSEDLGNGMTVGFQLENGFNIDDGKLANGGRLFGRQASLYVKGDFGTVAFGRMGGLASSCGSYDVFWGIGDAFGGQYKIIEGLAISDRYDNMVTYQTPKFSGIQATVQYSFNEDTANKNREGSSAVNRYAAAGVTGEFGAVQTAVAYEFQNYQSIGGTQTKDGHTVYAGANYDCGFAKTFLMGQYFKNVSSTSAIADLDAADAPSVGPEGITGYGLGLGTVVPLGAAKLTVAAYYTDAELEDTNTDYTSVAFGGKYEYFISKRTSVYAAAGFFQYDQDGKADKVNAYTGLAGLTHRF